MALPTVHIEFHMIAIRNSYAHSIFLPTRPCILPLQTPLKRSVTSQSFCGRSRRSHSSKQAQHNISLWQRSSTCDIEEILNYTHTEADGPCMTRAVVSGYVHMTHTKLRSFSTTHTSLSSHSSLAWQTIVLVGYAALRSCWYERVVQDAVMAE